MFPQRPSTAAAHPNNARLLLQPAQQHGYVERKNMIPEVPRGIGSYSNASSSSTTDYIMLQRLHTTLRMQMGTVRSVFKDMDYERNGFAKQKDLKALLLKRLFIGDLAASSSSFDVEKNENPISATKKKRSKSAAKTEAQRDAWSKALDQLLSLADPLGNGEKIEFGRLARLIRTPNFVANLSSRAAQQIILQGSKGTEGEEEHLAAHQGEELSLLSKHMLSAASNDDEQLRHRFSGVNIGNRFMDSRLKDSRPLEKMSTVACTTNILGDTNIFVPWAILGDETRMDHILNNLQVEKRLKLLQTLRSAAFDIHHKATPLTSSSSHKNLATPTLPLQATDLKPSNLAKTSGGQLTFGQLLRGLRDYDPFVHDVEVLQYYTCMLKQQDKTTEVMKLVHDAKQRYETHLRFNARKVKSLQHYQQQHQKDEGGEGGGEEITTGKQQPKNKSTTMGASELKSALKKTTTTAIAAPPRKSHHRHFSLRDKESRSKEQVSELKTTTQLGVNIGTSSLRTVKANEFFRQYGNNVLTSPAMRSSAEFTLKWDLRIPRVISKIALLPRPPTAPQPHTSR